MSTAVQAGPSSSSETRGSISAASGRDTAYLPRPSTSSTRSKPTPADFEAALKNPQTIFLSGSSPISEEAPPMLPDADAPEPTIKRSFEEDLHKGATPSKYGYGAGIGGGPGLIPPSAGAGASSWKAGLVFNRDRRESSATQHSGLSGSSGGTPSKVFKAKGPAVGLDAEIAAQNPVMPKRRSIFRSPGTASSPDLATLVRKSKKHEPPLPPIPSGSSKLAKPVPFANASPASRVPTSNSGRSAGSQVSNGSGGEAGSSADGWDKVGSGAGSSRMATIREGTNGYSGHHEEHKSMAEKARGVFGRMFGSSSKSSPITSRRSVSSSAHLPMEDPFAASPSLPPRLAKPPAGSSSPIAPTSDVFGSVAPVSPRAPTARSTAPSTHASPYIGGSSAIPTGRRSPGFAESPKLPQEQPNEAQIASRPSGHTREPATTDIDEEPPHVPTPSIERTGTFTQDVAGALADLGQESPARQLGLPDEKTLKRDATRATSMETMRATPQAPIERERSVSADVPPFKITGKPLPVVVERTSSLPRIMPPPNNAESGPSSPPGSPSAEDHSFTRITQPSTELPPATSSDFGPSGNKTDDQDTIRAPSKAASPHAASIRLVGTPKPAAWPPAYNDPSREKLEDDHDESPIMDIVNDDAVGVGLGLHTADGETEDDEEKGRRLACEFLEENWTSVPWEKVAMFIGGPRPVNAVALRYYMQYFDMKGQNLVESFRDLCAKLHLKAESQEIDRIIEGFSARYYECNPNTVFGTTGVVHTVTGAMLMLNTDLHIADLSKHMSRADFIRNAMRAIQESMPSNDGTSTPDLVRDDSSRFGSVTSMATPTQDTRSKPLPSVPSSVATQLPTQRSTSAPVPSQSVPQRTVSDSAMPFGPGLEKARGSTFSVGSATYSKAWEVEAENALRDIYTAVRTDKILLPISALPSARPSLTSLNGSNPYDLNRKGTMRSPSDRVNALKRASMRGSPFLNNPYSSGFSYSDGRLSPTSSFGGSINDPTHLHATLGFASNLTHSVIREHEDEVHSIDSDSSTATLDELTDDELALLGAPWAKEGMLQHKLYWESTGKRGKKHEWKQFFVVVSKGELFMFTFGDSSSKGSFTGGKVGGGNWLTNANPVGTIDLMHTHASTPPKPTLHVDRPHSFSLVASNGQTTIFQAGTADLVQEWITTCNYWAGRRSRQPLAGGVSNMEYGWQRVQGLSGVELLKLDDDHASVRSGKSNISKLGGSYGRNRPLGRGDRVHINDWKPPIPAALPSPLDEEAQLDALQVYVKSLDAELDEHKALEEPMIRQYTPGSKNALKAKENWRVRLAYLQAEVEKYDTYIEALRGAIAQRVKEQGKRKLDKSLARSNASLHRRDSEDMLSKLAGGEDEEISRSPVTPKAKQGVR